MNEFVNYKKRSIDLPPGCKNLHDVLQLQSPVTREESGARTLPDIGKYVELGLEPGARSFWVLVISPDERLTLHVGRHGDAVAASGTIQKDSGLVTAMRDFFSQRGLDQPKDSGLPPMFPSLPVRLFFNISPMPLQGPILSKLITDLLREVLGANEDTKLPFQYLEFTDAA